MATTKTDGRTGLKGGPAAKPAHVIDEQLHNDITLISKAAEKVVVIDEGSIEIPADKLGRAVDLLGLTRALVRNTEADYKAKVEKIPDPFAKYLSEKKAIVSRAKEIEAELETGLQELIRDGVLGTDGMETNSGCRLSLVAKRELVMVDPELIPDEYLLPRGQCLDWGAIKAKIEADEKAVAAAKEAGIVLKIENPVTGAHLATTYTFRTKLPDELGN